MDLQLLFEEPIDKVEALHPGYEEHASDVWLVKTNKQEVVVRTSRMSEVPNNDFWWGCKRLFGIDPREVFRLEYLNHTLGELSSIPIPKIIKKAAISSKQFVVVEKLKGAAVQSFKNQPPSLLEDLGEGLATIHQFQVNYAGSPSGDFKIPLDDFNKHVIEGMTDIVSRFHQGNDAIKKKLPEMAELFRNMPIPQTASFVLVDMDPTQFLWDGKRLTGLVDTEAYVIAPRELDFIGLEYILDRKAIEDFIKGYEKVMDLPDLKGCRQPYRYLYRLLSVQGSVNIDDWLQHETLL